MNPPRVNQTLALSFLAVALLASLASSVFNLYEEFWWLQRFALLLTHVHLQCKMPVGQRCASVDAPMMEMVQLHCNLL